MNRILWLTTLSIVLAGVLAGCAAPEAIPPLTEQEKAQMVEIALAAPEVSERIGPEDTYEITVGWSAVSWDGDEATGFSIVEYEDIADGKLPTDRVFPDGATINPYVYVSINPPTGMQLHITFNREEMKVMGVQLMPGRGMGPQPPDEEQ